MSKKLATDFQASGSIIEQEYPDVGGFRKALISGTNPGWVHLNSDGVPITDKRFLNIKDFNEGYAAVQEFGGASYHITEAGVPAYSSRFLEVSSVFGGVSAVRDKQGAYHIRKDGSAAYDERYLLSMNNTDGRALVVDQNRKIHSVSFELDI